MACNVRCQTAGGSSTSGGRSRQRPSKAGGKGQHSHLASDSEMKGTCVPPFSLATPSLKKKHSTEQQRQMELTPSKGLPLLLPRGPLSSPPILCSTLTAGKQLWLCLSSSTGPLIPYRVQSAGTRDRVLVTYKGRLTKGRHLLL